MFRDVPVKSRYVTTLVIPPSSGSVSDLFAFFPGKSISQVDGVFLRAVNSIGSDYRTPGLRCFVYNLGAGNKDDEIRGSLDIIPGILDGHQICAILELRDATLSRSPTGARKSTLSLGTPRSRESGSCSSSSTSSGTRFTSMLSVSMSGIPPTTRRLW